MPEEKYVVEQPNVPPIEQRPVEQPIVERRDVVTRSDFPERALAEPIRISWGAVLGGAVASLALWALLDALGLALGLTPVNPDNPDSLRISGIFTGIWSLIVPIIALFAGAFVAARGAGVLTRGGGALHGLVMWGLTTLAGLWLVGTLATGLVGGAISMGQAMDLGSRAPAAFGLDAEDALAPVNDRLRAQGRPEVMPEEVQSATQDEVRDAMRTGDMDRAALVRSLERNTSLSRSDAHEVATRIEVQVDKARGGAMTGAMHAAKTTGKVMWGIFGALALGLLAAIFGGMLGASRRKVTPIVTPVPREA